MIPLFKPHMPDLPEITNILYSGMLSYGKNGHEFERLLANFIGVENVLVTNSYNMALLVALTTLNIKSGDEVILSPMACLASTQPLLSIGILTRWADIDPTTGTLSPDSVKKRITKKTKAIIHNHFCGFIGYIDEINDIGHAAGIPVIDDCIEAFGGEYKNRKLGNVGTDVTIFSFNAVRIPNTIDGGAVIFKNKRLHELSVLVRDCGIDRSKFRNVYGEINPECDISVVGHSATMSEINAYIGIQQMKEISKIITIQRDNAKKWDDLLMKDIENHPRIKKITINTDSNPNYWVYGILTENKNAVMHEFREQGYYASGVHLRNDHYSVFSEKIYLPGVTKFSESFLAIPCGWWVSI